MAYECTDVRDCVRDYFVRFKALELKEKGKKRGKEAERGKKAIELKDTDRTGG